MPKSKNLLFLKLLISFNLYSFSVKIKQRLRVRFFSCSGDATHLKNTLWEILRWFHAKTKTLRQSICATKEMENIQEHASSCRYGVSIRACAALPFQKIGNTLRHYWQQAKTCREKFNQINVLRPCFVRPKNIFGNRSLPTGATSSLSRRGNNYLSCPLVISSEKSRVLPRLNKITNCNVFDQQIL